MSHDLNHEFNLVSDWLATFESDSHESWEIAVASPVFHLGPIFELATSLARYRGTSLKELTLPFETQTTRHLSQALQIGISMAVNTNVGASGVMSFSDCASQESADNLVVNFADEVVRKCQQIGIPLRMAQASSGAMEEMLNNALSHSANLQSAIIGFRAQPHLFEFCVFDSGIGILQSLKQNPKFAHLDDEGEALELAIVDGISRHGPGKAHGNGFRDIFHMPNNHKGYFWLRSGDCALVVDSGEISLPNVYTKQIRHNPGVLVSAAFLV